MIQLKVLKGPQKLGEEYDLATGNSKILGRGNLCDIQLLSYGVSKQHCKLTALPGGKLEIEDLGSSNGTYVNGVQVQKHIIRPGDSLGLSDFLFQIQWKPDLVPSLQQASFEGIGATPGINLNTGAENSTGQTGEIKLSAKKSNSAQALFASWIDPIAENFPVHKVIFIGFLVWTFLTVILSVFPFSKQANLRIQENSIQVAKLYARQLARLNQKAIIDQRYSDIIGTLDEHPGLTRGILKSYIFDSQRGRIMAPSNEAGNSLPNAYAVKAAQQSEEWWAYDASKNLSYVSAPILVGTAEGNLTAATAFVVFDPSSDIFSFANILENALTSLIILLAFSLVVAFVYQRFVIVPIQQLSLALERAVISNTAFEKPKIGWQDLQDMSEKISTLISRLPQNSSGNSEAPEDWNVRIANDIGQAAAAFDEGLKILEWSDSMAQISGVRREYAVGAEIGVASRDMAFEANIRDLAAKAQLSPWSPQNSTLEFQGRNYVMSMIYGSNSFLLLLRKEDE
ncbi:MAG: FHA domain-containing protein [Bdellovibrionota bacterium]